MKNLFLRYKKFIAFTLAFTLLCSISPAYAVDAETDNGIYIVQDTIFEDLTDEQKVSENTIDKEFSETEETKDITENLDSSSSNEELIYVESEETDLADVEINVESINNNDTSDDNEIVDTVENNDNPISDELNNNDSDELEIINNDTDEQLVLDSEIVNISYDSQPTSLTDIQTLIYDYWFNDSELPKFEFEVTSDLLSSAWSCTYIESDEGNYYTLQLDFEFTPQPSSIDDVQNEINKLMPDFRQFEVASELMPNGYSCDEIYDKELGVRYYSWFMGITATATSVSNEIDLVTAIYNAPTNGTETIVEIINDFNMSTINIPANRNIVITTPIDTAYTLSITGDYRHFEVNGQLTLANDIILEGRGSNYGGGVHN